MDKFKSRLGGDTNIDSGRRRRLGPLLPAPRLPVSGEPPMAKGSLFPTLRYDTPADPEPAGC